jgi:hypothetical protein
MSCNSTNISEQGQLLALLAAANTLSPDKSDESNGKNSPQRQSSSEQNVALINAHNNTQSFPFLTREAKAEMVSMAVAVAPSLRSSTGCFYCG